MNLSTLLHPYRTARELQAQIDALTKLEITEFSATPGKITLKAANEYIYLIAAHLLDIFKISGGTNYVEWQLNTNDGPYIVTLQRKLGKSPGELKCEAEANLEAARDWISDGRNYLESVPRLLGPDHILSRDARALLDKHAAVEAAKEKAK